MICRNCGNEIRDDARFCPHCGAANAPGPAGGTPSYSSAAPAWEGPEGGGKKKKTGLIIGIAVAAVAVVALIAAAVTGLFASPKGQVEKAIAKSVAAYAAAEERLGMPDTTQWQKDRSILQSIGLRLNSINSQLTGYDLSALSGLEISATAGYSGEDRYMLAEAAANWDSDELFLFRMVADDAELYFHSPQFTGETHYGVNTETLGADLAEMTGDYSMEDVSFNLFELVDIVLEQMDPDAMEQAMEEANKALWEAAQVKKEGAKTLDLNGTSTKTTLYHVTLPQEALERYVDDMLDVMSVIDYYRLYEELFQAMGMPRDELEDFLDELEDLDPYSELADMLKDALDDFGDLELDLCLSGGYVSAILYEDEIDGADVELALYLGGNEEYVDDLSAELTVNSTRITLESTGDHGLKGGSYTDVTTIQVRQLGTNVAKITSELSFDPKMEEDNLQWELNVTSSGLSLFSVEAQGSLYVKEDIIDLTLENATCKMMGMELCSLRFNYRICRFPDWVMQPMEDTRLITEMDMMELAAFASQLERNAGIWLADMQALFMARLPAELLYGMMY